MPATWKHAHTGSGNLPNDTLRRLVYEAAGMLRYFRGAIYKHGFMIKLREICTRQQPRLDT